MRISKFPDELKRFDPKEGAASEENAEQDAAGEEVRDAEFEENDGE